MPHGCQAGRHGEDAHFTHSCSKTHRDCGGHHGGPGSGDAREDPPADAEAAGGHSAEKQRRKGKDKSSPIHSPFLNFCLRVSSGSVPSRRCVCAREI